MTTTLSRTVMQPTRRGPGRPRLYDVYGEGSALAVARLLAAGWSIRRVVEALGTHAGRCEAVDTARKNRILLFPHGISRPTLAGWQKDPAIRALWAAARLCAGAKALCARFDGWRAAMEPGADDPALVAFVDGWRSVGQKIEALLWHRAPYDYESPTAYYREEIERDPELPEWLAAHAYILQGTSNPEVAREYIEAQDPKLRRKLLARERAAVDQVEALLS